MRKAIDFMTSFVCALLCLCAVVGMTVAVCKHVFAPTYVVVKVSKACWGDV